MPRKGSIRRFIVDAGRDGDNEQLSFFTAGSQHRIKRR
jgi:hypothetical protein